MLAGDGFKIEKVLYQSEPGTLIPSLLYLPARAGSKPAVVLAAGEGKAASSQEAESLARAGLVVLSIDARGFGETRSAGDPNDGRGNCISATTTAP